MASVKNYLEQFYFGRTPWLTGSYFPNQGLHLGPQE